MGGRGSTFLESDASELDDDFARCFAPEGCAEMDRLNLGFGAVGMGGFDEREGDAEMVKDCDVGERADKRGRRATEGSESRLDLEDIGEGELCTTNVGMAGEVSPEWMLLVSIDGRRGVDGEPRSMNDSRSPTFVDADGSVGRLLWALPCR